MRPSSHSPTRRDQRPKPISNDAILLTVPPFPFGMLMAPTWDEFIAAQQRARSPPPGTVNGTTVGDNKQQDSSHPDDSEYTTAGEGTATTDGPSQQQNGNETIARSKAWALGEGRHLAVADAILAARRRREPTQQGRRQPPVRHQPSIEDDEGVDDMIDDASASAAAAATGEASRSTNDSRHNPVTTAPRPAVENEREEEDTSNNTRDCRHGFNPQEVDKEEEEEEGEKYEGIVTEEFIQHLRQIAEQRASLSRSPHRPPSMAEDSGDKESEDCEGGHPLICPSCYSSPSSSLTVTPARFYRGHSRASHSNNQDPEDGEFLVVDPNDEESARLREEEIWGVPATVLQAPGGGDDDDYIQGGGEGGEYNADCEGVTDESDDWEIIFSSEPGDEDEE